MKEISVPYGRTRMTAMIDERRLLGIYTASLPPAATDQDAEVKKALDAPESSPPLEELARHVSSAVVIASDHTRPVPSRIIMPQILRRLRQNNPSIDITILVATGCHRETTAAELEAKFGSEIAAKEKIVVHDCRDESMLADLGTLPSGGRLRINRLATETDLLVAEGFIEPHFFAGFSGGRKSILPGIAAAETVMANHCAEFINSPRARTGILEDNPIHRDMVFAAERAKLAFIVNVVINADKEIVRAFAGDPFAAHQAGCGFLSSYCRIRVPRADIVITGNGGHPLDQNVYQSVKGMTAGEAVCRENGVIIMAAGCADGHGGADFHRALKEMSSPEELLARISSVPAEKTPPDQWQYQILARILAKHHVVIVTKDCPHEMIRDMRIDAASSIEEALGKADAIVGENASVAVIPDGVSVIASAY